MSGQDPNRAGTGGDADIADNVIEIDSLDSIKLDPYDLTCCVQSLTVYALLLATTLYLLLGGGLLSTLSLLATYPRVTAVIVIVLPIYTWFALGALNRRGLYTREDAERALRACPDGAELVTVLDSVETTLCTDAKLIGIRAPIELRYRKEGSPYTFQFGAVHTLVVSLEWISLLHESSDDISERTKGVRAILLHELGHIHGKDSLFIGLTNILFAEALVAGTITLCMTWSFVALYYVAALCLLQYLLNGYVARRREAFADMMAVKFQRTIDNIESQLRLLLRSGLEFQVHGAFAVMGYGFVSTARRNAFSRLWSKAVGHYFDMRKRLSFLRNGVGNFADLSSGDFFLLGVLGGVLPLVAAGVAGSLIDIELVSIAISVFVMLHVYLLCRIAAAYRLVAAGGKIAIKLLCHLLGYIVGYSIVFLPAWVAFGGYGWLFFFGVSIWNTWAFVTFLGGAIQISGRGRDAYLRGAHRFALFHTLATGVFHILLHGSLWFFPAAGILLCYWWFYGPHSSTSFAERWYQLLRAFFFLGATDTPDWRCELCDATNGSQLQTMGLLRACAKCQRLAFEEITVVMD